MRSKECFECFSSTFSSFQVFSRRNETFFGTLKILKLFAFFISSFFFTLNSEFCEVSLSYVFSFVSCYRNEKVWKGFKLIILFFNDSWRKSVASFSMNFHLNNRVINLLIIWIIFCNRIKTRNSKWVVKHLQVIF